MRASFSTLLLFCLVAVSTCFSHSAFANYADFSGGVAIGTNYAGVVTAPSNGLIVQGNAGLGTSAPDALLSLGGQVAQVIDMIREATGGVAGNNLMVKAGGAASGGTDL